MWEENTKTLATSGNSFASRLTFIYNGRVGVKFEEILLRQDKISCSHRTIVDLFIVYELDTFSHLIKELILH